MGRLWSPDSEKVMGTLHPRLVHLCQAVRKHKDCAVIEGFRDEALQNMYYRLGKSQVKWKDSEHNEFPSKAVHLVPYNAQRDPHVDWDNELEFYVFGGFVLAIAKVEKISIRWGGDWDGDFDPSDQKFNDLIHFELLE